MDLTLAEPVTEQAKSIRGNVCVVFSVRGSLKPWNVRFTYMAQRRIRMKQLKGFGRKVNVAILGRSSQQLSLARREGFPIAKGYFDFG